MDLHYELRHAALRMENGAFLQEPELLIQTAAELTTLRARIAELEQKLANEEDRSARLGLRVQELFDKTTELEREKGELARDKARLDWLTEQGCSKRSGWLARMSETGRGYRLHQSTRATAEHVTPREAIDAAMKPTT